MLNPITHEQLVLIGFDILPDLKDLSLPTSPPFLEAIQPSRHPGLELL